MRFMSVVAVSSLLLLAGCQPSESISSARDRTASVHGSATISTPPDRVAFTVGVETRDTSATAAFKTNTAKVHAVLAALRGRGVTEKQMQTSHLEVDTIPARAKIPRTFKVANLVTVIRQDPAEVGSLIEAAVAAGANDVGRLRFFVADVSAFEHEGLQQAFKNARAKAEVLARESGTTLGDVISMTDQTTYPDNDLRGQLRSLGYVGSGGVEAGSEQLQFVVTVVFALR
jgi:uncharacterized protein YggE